MAEKYVYVVKFSNYHPAEIDSIWSTKENALARADELNAFAGGDWRVEEWPLDPSDA
jgi:hypothetical protein